VLDGRWPLVDRLQWRGVLLDWLRWRGVLLDRLRWRGVLLDRLRWRGGLLLICLRRQRVLVREGLLRGLGGVGTWVAHTGRLSRSRRPDVGPRAGLGSAFGRLRRSSRNPQVVRPGQLVGKADG
jgi:hypothetical protein